MERLAEAKVSSFCLPSVVTLVVQHPDRFKSAHLVQANLTAESLVAVSLAARRETYVSPVLT